MNQFSNFGWQSFGVRFSQRNLNRSVTKSETQTSSFSTTRNQQTLPQSSTNNLSNWDKDSTFIGRQGINVADALKALENAESNNQAAITESELGLYINTLNNQIGNYESNIDHLSNSEFELFSQLVRLRTAAQAVIEYFIEIAGLDGNSVTISDNDKIRLQERAKNNGDDTRLSIHELLNGGGLNDSQDQLDDPLGFHDNPFTETIEFDVPMVTLPFSAQAARTVQGEADSAGNGDGVVSRTELNTYTANLVSLMNGQTETGRQQNMPFLEAARSMQRFFDDIADIDANPNSLTAKRTISTADLNELSLLDTNGENISFEDLVADEEEKIINREGLTDDNQLVSHEMRTSAHFRARLNISEKMDAIDLDLLTGSFEWKGYTYSYNFLKHRVLGDETSSEIEGLDQRVIQLARRLPVHFTTTGIGDLFDNNNAEFRDNIPLEEVDFGTRVLIASTLLSLFKNREDKLEEVLNGTFSGNPLKMVITQGWDDQGPSGFASGDNRLYIRAGSITAESDHHDYGSVLIHEYIHNLDNDSGGTDGVLPALTTDQQQEFINERERLYQRWDEDENSHQDLFALAYGLGTSGHRNGELLAQSVELFLEVPEELYRISPVFYTVYAQYFQLDPLNKLTFNLEAVLPAYEE